MGKRTKIVLTVLLVFVIVCMAGLVIGANYLVTFALRRTDHVASIAPASSVVEADRDIISENRKIQKQEAEAWLAACEMISIEIPEEPNLTLRGEAQILPQESHRWVIAVHGYQGSRKDMIRPAGHFGQRGYNVLLPDLRGCGESDGELLGMGWLDRLDMLSWIDWIICRDPEAEIVLYGISMGGAPVMMTAGEALPEQVKAVVEDCGYTSVWEMFSDELRYLYHLPEFPLMNVGSAVAKYRAGYSFREASAISQVRKATLPILFIHGAQDNFVQTDMVYRLYEACHTEKDLLVVEGAGHGSSYLLMPELYFDTVFSFLERYGGLTQM